MRWVSPFLILLVACIAVGVLAAPPAPPAPPAAPDACVVTNNGVEVCDGVDNDCDGFIDEAANGSPLTRSTSCGVGVCSGNSGYETCVMGVWTSDTCDPLFGAHLVNGVPSEICGSEADDDCNGFIDEDDSACTLITCYQCSGYGTFTSDEFFNACPAAWTATVLTAADCDVPVTCYQCDSGQVASAVYMNACPSGWSLTQPASCSVTCYQCSAGAVVSQVFVGGCGSGWSLTQPASCAVPLVSCYRCQDGGTGVVLTELRESCDGLWSSSVLTQDDCVVDVTCYRCSQGEVVSGNFTSQCPVDWSATMPASCGADLVLCYRCQDGKNGVVLTDLRDSCGSGWTSQVLVRADCTRTTTTTSSGGGRSFYVPTTSADTGADAAGEEQESSVMVIFLNWTYSAGVASATVGEPTSPVKRLRSNVREGAFLVNSTLISGDLDPLVVPLPNNFSLFHRFRFGGDVDGVVFEELMLTFTVKSSWLQEQNSSSDQVVVLYPFDGRWRIAPATYNDASRMFEATMVNVPLKSIAIGVGNYSAREEVISRQVEVPVQDDGLLVEPVSERSSWNPVLLGSIIALLLGGLLVAFFLVPEVPFLGGVHDAVRDRVGGLFHHEAPASQPSASASEFPSLTAPAVAGLSALPVREQSLSHRPYEVVDEQKMKYAELLQRVEAFIQKKRSANVPDEQIISSLRSAGWNDDVIGRYFGR